MLEIVTVPALEVFDNYYFLIHDSNTGRTAAVDCGRADPVLAALSERGWRLDEIWLTHHHWDHVDGVADLKVATGARVLGCPVASPNLPPVDVTLSQEGRFSFGAHEVNVMHVPGHADGHIAFHIPSAKTLFSGDCLMSLGCGRLLEGTADEMWHSLCRLSTLPRDTMVYSGHEYTLGNAHFAATIERDNMDLMARVHKIEAQRGREEATVPSLLGLELDTNPFLRANLPSVKVAVGLEDAPDATVFAELRARKDRA